MSTSRKRKLTAAPLTLFIYAIINLTVGILFFESFNTLFNFFNAVAAIILTIVLIYIPGRPVSFIGFIPFIALYLSYVRNSALMGGSAVERLLNTSLFIFVAFVALIILGFLGRNRRLIRLILKSIVFIVFILVVVATIIRLPRHFYGISYLTNFNGFLLSLSTVFALKFY